MKNKLYISFVYFAYFVYFVFKIISQRVAHGTLEYIRKPSIGKL